MRLRNTALLCLASLSTIAAPPVHGQSSPATGVLVPAPAAKSAAPTIPGRYVSGSGDGGRAAAIPAESTTVRVAPGPNQPPADLVIGPGDLLEVSVFGASDFDKQVRVNNDGIISLPLIGGVKVAGLTLNQAESELAKRLADGGYFNDPKVSIFAKEYASEAISVLGQVQKPGTYPLLGGHTLLDALSAAGGTTAKAGQTVTITHRDRPNAPEKIHFTPGKEAESNVQLHAGDIVMVSQAGIVYVVGDVKQPTGIVLENPSLTVLQAIAMAQGTTPTAKLNSAKLIRKSANGGQQEIAIPLKNILESKAPDVQLQANDIVFIPNSAGKSAARKGLETALQAVVGLSVYRP